MSHGTTQKPLYFIAVLSSSLSGLEYRMLTASKERGKRAAFAEIVRSGHSKQNQHAVFVHSTVVRKHSLFCVDVPLLQVNLPALLLRQSLPRPPTNLGNKNIEPSKDGSFALLLVFNLAGLSKVRGQHRRQEPDWCFLWRPSDVCPERSWRIRCCRLKPATECTR